MSTGSRIAFAALTLWGAQSFAHAGEVRCVSADVPKKAIEALGGAWIIVTPDEWQFLRGIYAMNPSTPPGLPYGDKAVLARIAGRETGLVFFLDGDRACTPMEAPKALMELLEAVAVGKIDHEGEGM